MEPVADLVAEGRDAGDENEDAAEDAEAEDGCDTDPEATSRVAQVPIDGPRGFGVSRGEIL